jgi:exosortase K
MTFFRISRKNLIFYFLAVVLFICAKFFSQTADHSDLKFILSPTVSIIEAFTGFQYAFQDDCGYNNKEINVVIGKSCAGFNTLIAAFCMSVFAFIHVFKESRVQLFAFLLFMAGAYLFTVLTNSFRIIGSLLLINLHPFFDNHLMHEVIGIFFSFFFLVLYYFILKISIHKIIYKHENPVKTSLDIHYS